MSVLVVEDDASTCELMKRLLGRSGYQVRCAMTLAEAMAQLESRPCCILLDLTLPDGNGLTLLQHVRDEKLSIPVAIVTGKTGEQTADAVMLKPSALFRKPVDITDVVTWVRDVCPAAQ